MNPSYDEYADSDEDQHDAYLERMKEEGKIREENANDSSDDSAEETGGLASVLSTRMVRCSLLWPGLDSPLGQSWCLGEGVGISIGAEADASCALFQMSHSTQVKRRKMWQRSEFWWYLVGIRW